MWNRGIRVSVSRGCGCGKDGCGIVDIRVSVSRGCGCGKDRCGIVVSG